MSNQVDQEKQQAETLPSEEVRRFLLAELETKKQELGELSDEQLAEITGGLTPEDKTALKSFVCTLCGGAGAAIGAVVGHHFGGEPVGVPAMLPGFIAGHGVAHNVLNKILPSSPANHTSPEETAALRPNDSLTHWAIDIPAGPSH